MMPMPPRACLRCGTNLAPGVEYCPSCGTFTAATPNAQGAPWACLRTTSGEPVPLLGVALGGDVFGAHARLVLRQRYKNREASPIEAVYTFPIPGDATLVGFAMECEGRRIEAEVKEREEAFQAYDDAISKGHGAALLEQERPNVFTASVGNLLPGEETVVEVTFLQRLTADEGALRLMIPTLVAPKYIPGSPAGDRTGHGAVAPTNVVPDADRVTPKIGAVHYGLAMDLVFDLGRDVTIESPSHRIDVTDEGGWKRRVTFVSPTVALDRDIVLTAEGAPGVAAGIVCDKPAGEEGTFALTLVPDLFEAKKRSKGRAVVFVVDVSGSMSGDSIEQARRAMRLCMRHLGEGDLFDIVPFSSSYSHFSAASAAGRQRGAIDLVPFTQTTLRLADEYVGALDANGGTEMLAPLAAAAKLLSGVKRDRIVVLLTDGQVGNEAQIVDEISKQANGARVYTFGIGTNVSDWLLRELAKRTKGAVEFIHPGERIDEKVTAQFAKATAARVDELRVKWVGVDAGEVAPADPPALVDGEPWSVYGRYEAPGLGHVEIRGTLGGEAFLLEVPLELPASADRPALTSLWAGARVRDLEQMDTSAMGRRAETHKKRIVDLCVRHRIASKHASFVVVEKRTGDRRSQGMPETRAVPVNAPAGWAMFDKGAPQQQAMDAGMRTQAGVVSPQMMHAMKARMAPPPPPMMAAPAPARAYAAPTGAPPPPAQYGAPPPPPPPPGFAPPPPAPGGYRPPPPAPMAPARPAAKPAAAAPMAMPMSRSAPEPPKGGGGGLMERAKRALGLSKEKAAPPAPPQEEGALFSLSELTARSAPEAPETDDAPAPMDLGVVDALIAKPGEDIGGMFARQLASGLWESRDTSDRGRLVETTACLVRCARESVDSSHSVYGAQVAKAVDALCALMETFAQKGEHDEDVIPALLAAAAVSSGKRARARIGAIAQGAKSDVVKAITPELSSQDSARKKLG